MSRFDRESVEVSDKYRSLIFYHPETGSFIWREIDASLKDSPQWNSQYAGKEAGASDASKGYINISTTVGGTRVKHKAHRIAWLLTYGHWPSGQIDHINRIKSDNRLENLRLVTQSTNQKNSPKKKNNTSGFTGVTLSKQSGKWIAQCGDDGKHHHVGVFNSPEDANKAIVLFRASKGFSETHGV